jgi:hypothetical protein
MCSFSVIINNCGSMTNLKNLTYTPVNKINIEFNNIYQNNKTAE